MKAKILKYSESEMNKVVRSYKDLEQIEGNIYKYDKSKEYQDYIYIVICIKGIYIETQSFNKRMYSEKKALILEFYRNLTFEDNYLKCIEQRYDNKLHITSLDIELLKDLGKNVTKYIELRKEREFERINKEVERAEEERKQEEAEKERERQKREIEIKEAEKDYSKGKSIDSELFIELCKRYGVSLHIRTIGSIRKNITEVSEDGYTRSGKTNSVKVFKAARELFEILNR